MYLIRATFSVSSLVSSSCRFWVRKRVKTACEREEVSFMLVAATVLAYKVVFHEISDNRAGGGGADG